MDKRPRIQHQKWYRPREIVDMGLIVNSRGKPSYDRILELIKSGELKAKNYSIASKKKDTNPYYLVLGADLVTYLDKHN